MNKYLQEKNSVKLRKINYSVIYVLEAWTWLSAQYRDRDFFKFMITIVISWYEMDTTVTKRNFHCKSLCQLFSHHPLYIFLTLNYTNFAKIVRIKYNKIFNYFNNFQFYNLDILLKISCLIWKYSNFNRF